MLYSSFGILALVLHLIINYDVLIKKDRSNDMPAYTPYRAFLISLLVYYVADISWGLLYEHKLVTLAYIDTFLYFASMAVTVLMWTRYVIAYLDERKLFSNILSGLGYVIFIYAFINLIINFFNPVVFAFEADGTYVPGVSRYVTLAIQVVMFFSVSAYSLFTAVRPGDKNRHHHRTIGLSGLAMTVFIVLQAYDPYLPFYAIGCMLGTSILHTFVLEDEKEIQKKNLEERFYREKEQREELESAKQMAYTDSLTGVKNKHAYIEAEAALDERIAKEAIEELGIVVFDLNGLKLVNDTKGHEEGDEFIKTACRMICKTFTHSPVFRIGGDEFVAILEGEDFKNRSKLLSTFDFHIEENRKHGRVVIASGLDELRPGIDEKVAQVFERADQKMYEYKKHLKNMT